MSALILLYCFFFISKRVNFWNGALAVAAVLEDMPTSVLLIS